MQKLFSLKKPENHIICIYIILVICISLNVYYSSVGWNNSLLEHHAFRQTFTAIPTFYMLKNGLTIFYETPIFGPPWKFPNEFPTYQLIVAFLCRTFDFPLQQTGRFVSLTFSYLSIGVLFLILKNISKNKYSPIIVVILMLVSPTYLYWSRTFMIETTALFLTLAMILSIIWLLKTQKASWIYLGLVFATMSALTKVMTFFPGSLFCLSYCALTLYKEKSSLTFKAKLKTVSQVLLICAIVPLSIFLIWYNYYTAIVALNPLTTQKHWMFIWIFGTLDQKLDPKTWYILIISIGKYILGLFFSNEITFIITSIILILLFIVSAYSSLSAFFLLLVFFSTLIIFTNVYFIHNYYFMASACYFYAALSLFMGFMIKQKIKIISLFILSLLICVSLTGYYKYYLPVQSVHPNANFNHQILTNAANFVGTHTNRSDIILIYQSGWDPSFSYLINRRTVINDGLRHNEFNRVVNQIAHSQIKGLVFLAKVQNRQNLIETVPKQYGFKEPSVYDDGWIKIYLK